MQDTIFYVGGSKGGVGKSLISTVLVQFLLDRYGDEKTIHLIETDDSNPDVGRIYQGKIPVTPLILDERDTGWITLFARLDGATDTLFVINSAARSNYGVETNGGDFTAALLDGSVHYDFVTFWPINRQLDCVNLLKDYIRVMLAGPIFPIRNTYWGAPKDFTIYDAVMSKGKGLELANERIPGVLDFPSLNDLITLQFYSHGKTIPEVAAALNVFKRQLFNTWKNKAYAMFESTGLFSEAPAPLLSDGEVGAANEAGDERPARKSQGG
jgi:hypothetical protein